MKRYIVLRVYESNLEEMINIMTELGYKLFFINSLFNRSDFAVTFEYDPNEITKDISKDKDFQKKYRTKI